MHGGFVLNPCKADAFVNLFVGRRDASRLYDISLFCDDERSIQK